MCKNVSLLHLLKLPLTSWSWGPIFVFFFRYILKKLSVDQNMVSQPATFINLHLLSLIMKRFFRYRLITLPLFHPSPLFLVVSYLMASIELPQLMTKLFLVDPWVHQLGSQGVAIGSAFLFQGGVRSVKDTSLSYSFTPGLRIVHWRNCSIFVDNPALAPHRF